MIAPNLMISSYRHGISIFPWLYDLGQGGIISFWGQPNFQGSRQYVDAEHLYEGN